MIIIKKDIEKRTNEFTCAALLRILRIIDLPLDLSGNKLKRCYEKSFRRSNLNEIKQNEIKRKYYASSSWWNRRDDGDFALSDGTAQALLRLGLALRCCMGLLYDDEEKRREGEREEEKRREEQSREEKRAKLHNEMKIGKISIGKEEKREIRSTFASSAKDYGRVINSTVSQSPPNPSSSWTCTSHRIKSKSFECYSGHILLMLIPIEMN